jgi:hypothetical protein
LNKLPVVYLARHGETAWTVTGQHTGLTDLPLTERGERNARGLGRRLNGVEPARVFTSPLQRACRTCELAGFGAREEVDRDLNLGEALGASSQVGGYQGELAIRRSTRSDRKAAIRSRSRHFGERTTLDPGGGGGLGSERGNKLTCQRRLVGLNLNDRPPPVLNTGPVSSRRSASRFTNGRKPTALNDSFEREPVSRP